MKSCDDVKRVIVLFKTHFDYGYTAHAKDVYDRYMRVYIPAALDRAGEMRREGEDRFIWTTGSWLINEFLEHSSAADKKRMEKAILRGDVRWHGLPFTTHTELMDRELFEYGLSISKRLDARFGFLTFAAKLTDVPCHTRAIIDPMAEAGLRFLHIGNNPTSRAPEIPGLFRWRAPSGNEITVMYCMGYGETTRLPGTDTVIYFAHTGDNAGPQPVKEIQRLYKELHVEYPSARICAGTLEDVAEAVAGIHASLPVLTCEMGDSWIHGVGSDPRKVSDYRAMLRLREHWDGKDREEADRCLLRVPEHTWGSYLDPIMNDRHLYARDKFERVRGEARYQLMESTWREQRAFVTETLERVSAASARQAEAELKKYTRARRKTGSPVPVGSAVHVGKWTVGLDAHGAVDRLTYDGRIIADGSHRLCCFLYEVFSRSETDRYGTQYLESRYFPNLEPVSWDIFSKPGIQCAIDRYMSAVPELTVLRKTKTGLQADMRIASECVDRFGCPSELSLDIDFDGNRMNAAFRWKRKPASRVPEGLWLGMCPLAGNYRVRKLGEWIDPMETVRFGNRQMCATDWGVRWPDMTLETLDTALLAYGSPALLRFDDAMPDLQKGAWFSLFNNIWNTNFPMWYDEDALFRFVLAVEAQ